MIPVLSRAQMRAFDAHAIGVAHVPSLVLMENAGRGAAEHIEQLLSEESDDQAIVIVCGIGNNGGDGFVVARHLFAEPRAIEVFLCGDAARFTADARTNHDAFVALGGVVRSLENQADLEALRTELAAATTAVDALFGTGLDRPIQGLAAEAVVAMNESHATRVALDVPSGMNADTGVALGPTFRANTTITFGHLKLGLLTSRGAVHAGAIIVVGIGVPGDVPAVVGTSADLLERSDVAGWLEPRPLDAHKYSAGHVAALSGSPGKIGASLLVARGVLRSG
ncbi:MAG: NAD(P)H-hydrate epimerase, partial [Polyangiaceae bacterium]